MTVSTQSSVKDILTNGRLFTKRTKLPNEFLDYLVRTAYIFKFIYYWYILSFINHDLREVDYTGDDWKTLAEDREVWRAYAHAAMNLRIR